MSTVIEMKTTEPYNPRFREVDIGSFRQALFGFQRGDKEGPRNVTEKTANNRTTYYDQHGNEIGRTFQHKRRIQCQAGRLLQPHIVVAAKSNVSFDLAAKQNERQTA